MFKFTAEGKSVDSVVTLANGKTSELRHLRSVFVKKVKIQFFENFDDFVK